MKRLLRRLAAPGIALAMAAPLWGQGAVDDLSKAPRIAVAALKRLHQMNEVVVVDVRDAAAYRLGHIPGALSIPLETVPQRVEELRGARKSIVTYCASPEEHASARAALDLRGFGLTNVRALTGGWDQWLAAGGPVARGDTPNAGRAPEGPLAGPTSILTSR